MTYATNPARQHKSWREGSTNKGLILLIGALALSTGVVAWSMERTRFSPSEKQFSSGFTKHVLAIELPRDAGDVKEIVGELGDPNREIMRGKVQKDFLFIPSYALLFAALGWLLGRSDYRFAIWIGAGIAACAAGAAIFDVIENLRIFHVLDARLADTTQTMLDGLRLASLVKWAFVFTAMGLLSPIVFLCRELFTLEMAPRRLTAVFGGVVALAYFLAAVIGLIGLAQNPLIEKASVFMSLALLLTVLGLLFALLARRRPSTVNANSAA